MKQDEQAHILQCSEVWSGIRSIESTVVSRGLKAWIWSTPYREDAEGGDVHYLSLCSGGIVTRVVVADVCGHGKAVAAISSKLSGLLRRFMNSKKQDRVVHVINQEFARVTEDFRFATAVLMTYEHHRKRLQFSNAGHPPPLIKPSSDGQWQFLDAEDKSTSAIDSDGEAAENLPFGIDDEARFDTHHRSIGRGDRMVVYTDAFMEAHLAGGEMLGLEGLRDLVQSVSDSHPGKNFEEFGRELVQEFRRKFGEDSDDDETIMVIEFGEGRRMPGIKERLAGWLQFAKSRRATSSSI